MNDLYEQCKSRVFATEVTARQANNLGEARRIMVLTVESPAPAIYLLSFLGSNERLLIPSEQIGGEKSFFSDCGIYSFRTTDTTGSHSTRPRCITR